MVPESGSRAAGGGDSDVNGGGGLEGVRRGGKSQTMCSCYTFPG